MNESIPGKKRYQLKYLVPICIVFSVFATPVGTLAREVKIGGGAGIGYEFFDRQRDDDTNEQEEQSSIQPTTDNNNDDRYSRFRLAPLITLTSSAERDEIALRYSPSFRYDLESSDNDVDHDLSATLSRYLIQRWQLILSENYRLTDSVTNQGIGGTADTAGATDTAAGTESAVRLSDNEDRREYWTNILALRSEYVYRQDSLFSLGYSYNILENIDSGESSDLENYDRHELSSAVAHRFTSVWKLTVSGSYVRGLFDEVESEQTATDEVDEADEVDVGVENDLNEYRAATVLESNLLEHQLQRLSYNFFGVDYDAPEQINANIHNMTLDWQWDLRQDLMFSVGAGPTYIKAEDSDGEWGYNGNLALRYAFERGNIGVTAQRGFERQNFTGTDENGLREFWQARLGLTYQVVENFSADLFTSYRYEDEEVIVATAPVAIDQETTVDSADVTTTTETFNRKRFSAGASLGYLFWQWYQLSLSYDFSRQDSEQVDDSFDEHRIALTLSYEKEFLNW